VIEVRFEMLEPVKTSSWRDRKAGGIGAMIIAAAEFVAVHRHQADLSPE
jgi:hypothetical protein